MKNISFKLLIVAASLAAITYLPACKSKTASDANADSAAAQLPDSTIMTDQPAAPAPVQISTDDSLTNNLKDVTKDFPGVTATANNGEVTLKGDISRERLPKLLQLINALHPKKVNRDSLNTK